MFGWLRKRKEDKERDVWLKSLDEWPESRRAALYRWTDADRKNRVYLIERNDGLFTYGTEHYSNYEFEHCWIPDDAGAHLYDSEETALREILAKFPWTQSAERENNQR